ncbi:MAG TPA: AraC family transcriptional regulator ligand-binding domain-containing protein [Caldimonas sp.]|nr:AraC family transcriptional regulator ligand-binding domain-containing protein [Caldimonas sp.]
MSRRLFYNLLQQQTRSPTFRAVRVLQASRRQAIRAALTTLAFVRFGLRSASGRDSSAVRGKSNRRMLGSADRRSLTLRAIYLTLDTHGVGFFGRHAVQGAWVRSGVLVGAAELISELGGDVHVVCLAAQLDPAALVAGDLPVPAAAVTSFLEAAEHCACDSFGLRLAALQDLTVLGPLWVLMRSGATVGELLDNLTRYFVIFTTGALVGSERVEQGLFVTYSTASGISTDDRQIMSSDWRCSAPRCACMRRPAGNRPRCSCGTRPPPMRRCIAALSAARSRSTRIATPC